MVLALLEFAFVVLLSRVPNKMNTTLHDGRPGKGTHSNVGNLWARKVGGTESSTLHMLKTEKEKVEAAKNTKVNFNVPPPHVVDLISFCLYILLFISFNVIYWIHYQL